MALRKKYRKRTSKAGTGRRRRRSSVTKRSKSKRYGKRKVYRKKRVSKRRSYRKRYGGRSRGPSLSEMAFVVANYHPHPAAVENASTMTDAFEAAGSLGKRDYSSFVDSEGQAMSQLTE